MISMVMTLNSAQAPYVIYGFLTTAWLIKTRFSNAVNNKVVECNVLVDLGLATRALFLTFAQGRAYHKPLWF